MYVLTVHSRETIVKLYNQLRLLDFNPSHCQNDQLPRTIAPRKRYVMARQSKHSINITDVQRRTGLSRSTIYHALELPSKARRRTLDALRDAGVSVSPQVAVIVPPVIDDFAREEDLTYRELRQLLSVRLKPVERMTKDELRHIWQSASRFPGLYVEGQE